MRIAIPREIKPREGRIALIPEAVADLVRAGYRVTVETGAGTASGFPDQAYEQAGAEIAPDPAAVYQAGELIVKVKEPVSEELQHLRGDHLLFCYLHLAANPALARALQEIGVTAIAFETVAVGDRLPLLAPMSQIAGRLSVQTGAYLLHSEPGGRGVLLGGVPGAHRGRVTVLGAGMAGMEAIRLAAANGAEVMVFDRSPQKLDQANALAPNITALYPQQNVLARILEETDLLIGAVLLPGRRAPKLVRREDIARMPAGAIAIDISVDQGGCMETTRPTTYDAPTYVEEGVIHFAVTNMPGAVPRTASQALSGALSEYLPVLARGEWADHPALAEGVNVREGRIVHAGVKAELEAADEGD